MVIIVTLYHLILCYDEKLKPEKKTVETITESVSNSLVPKKKMKNYTLNYDHQLRIGFIGKAKFTAVWPSNNVLVVYYCMGQNRCYSAILCHIWPMHLKFLCYSMNFRCHKMKYAMI